MYRSAFMRTSILSLLVATVTSSCYTWAPSLAATPANPVADGRRVRITSQMGGRFEMTDARIVGDSVISEHRIGGYHPDVVRYSVALADITQVERFRFSSGRTAALVAGGVLAVPAVWVLLLVGSGVAIAPQY